MTDDRKEGSRVARGCASILVPKRSVAFDPHHANIHGHQRYSFTTLNKLSICSKNGSARLIPSDFSATGHHSAKVLATPDFALFTFLADN
jgi:hypothetical protein